MAKATTYKSNSVVVESMAFTGRVTLAALLALFLASGNWIAVAAIIGGLAILALVLVDLRAMTLGWIAGIPTIFVIPNNFLKALPFINTERALFGALVGSVIMRKLLVRTPPIRFAAVEWVMMAFLTYLVASFLTTLPAKPRGELRLDIATIVQGYAIPLMTFMVVRRLRWTDAMVRVALAVTTVTGVMAVVIAALRTYLGLKIFTPLAVQADYVDKLTGELGRITGTFGNAPEYGAVLGLFCLLLLPQVNWVRDRLLKICLLACAAPMIAGIYLAKTRSVFVIFALMAAYLCAVDRRVRKPFAVGTIVGAIGLAVALPWLDLEGFVARLTHLESIYNRIALAATAVVMWADNPIFGVGFSRYGFSTHRGPYYTSVGPVMTEWAVHVGVPHNEYLHLLVLTGFVGFAFYVTIFFLMFRKLRAMRLRPGATPVQFDCASHASAALLALVAMGLALDTGLFSYMSLLVYFIAGMAVSVAEDESARIPAAATPGPVSPALRPLRSAAR